MIAFEQERVLISRSLWAVSFWVGVSCCAYAQQPAVVPTEQIFLQQVVGVLEIQRNEAASKHAVAEANLRMMTKENEKLRSTIVQLQKDLADEKDKGKSP